MENLSNWLFPPGAVGMIISRSKRHTAVSCHFSSASSVLSSGQQDGCRHFPFAAVLSASLGAAHARREGIFSKCGEISLNCVEAI